MALRNIRLSNDEMLRKKSKPVTGITQSTLTLLDDMAETLYSQNGLGLAAPQVGVLRRIVVVDVGEGIVELINPELVEAEGTQNCYEGCLSIPDVSGLVERPLRVKIKALNRNGEEFFAEGADIAAIAFCHELDHLDGILYTDKATVIKNNEELEREEQENEARRKIMQARRERRQANGGGNRQ
ncbi:MAG: peptide deformylase [Clostridiales bacterium]|jgi:peptide deformylase|nr:peptide deformylase [Clostridiales bacterium]